MTLPRPTASGHDDTSPIQPPNAPPSLSFPSVKGNDGGEGGAAPVGRERRLVYPVSWRLETVKGRGVSGSTTTSEKNEMHDLAMVGGGRRSVWFAGIRYLGTP
ncbi:hypothetical protein LX32DRAFT_407253 [Colletotrichum zoysiae]|uniref:Uncharacterized protein n=1 Tax=Colletotrichum zoysiae TaxID=1216348 RepID=A0AAD9HHH7_9PEZI|nr:hypothetical protein LX32DRAFT_407253 [Colletotrichum zoysiae]